MDICENIKNKKPVQLSQRLQALADMVTPGNRVADVGCDHGFLSIYLVQKGIAPSVIATDVRPGPLSAARAHIAEQGLEAYIETRLSDGLSNYSENEADTLVCAGMGGPLMQRILTEHREVTDSIRELILQPQSELLEFRIFLREQGFVVRQENILCEDDKYYFMFRAEHGWEKDSTQNGDYQRLCDKFGRGLLEQKHPVLKAYLERGLSSALLVQEQLLAHRGPEGSNLRLEQSLTDNIKEIEDIKSALAMFNEEV